VASVPEAPSGILYADSSALVKLVVREAESGAVERELERWRDVATSVVSSIELARAVARARTQPNVKVADDLALLGVLAALAEVPLSDEIRAEAAALGPVELRALDAIHVAFAMSLGSDLGAVLTYDRRMQEALSVQALTILAPA